MNEPSTPEPQMPGADASVREPYGWAGVVVGTVLVTVVFAILPASYRLLGLYFPLLGICLGLIGRQFIEPTDRTGQSPQAVAIVVGLAILAVCAVTWRGYQLHRISQPADVEPAALIWRQMLESVPDGEIDPAYRQFRDEARRDLDTLQSDSAHRGTFSGYLARRWESVASLSAPWPELLWLAEAAVCVLTAATVFRWKTQPSVAHEKTVRELAD